MKIHYVSGSRADFGLMRSCLETINSSPELDLGIVVTGQHTSEHYGNTRLEIQKSQLTIAQEIPVVLQGSGGAEMANALATELLGFVSFWERERPDFVLLLGDRGEMLAAALAAVHLGIFVGHIHGGERSGTLDESFRHAISKLAHYHFPATNDAAERLRRMGEATNSITVIGAPGLVRLAQTGDRDVAWLKGHFSLPDDKLVALVIYHPVVQEASVSGAQIEAILESVKTSDYASVIMRPNSDAGGALIDEYLDSLPADHDCRVVTHLEREDYLKVLASSDLVIGNSSSEIIKSASFGIPCVNIGTRQNNRLRNDNTIDCRSYSRDKIREAIVQAQGISPSYINLYGDGKTDTRLVKALTGLNFDPRRLKKSNAY